MTEDERRPRLHIPGSDDPGPTPQETPGEESPKLQVDSDWKAQAQAEKERLARQDQEKEKERPARGGARERPEGNFKTLMSILASQAIYGLRGVQDPATGGVMVDLEGAKLSIDLLGMLEEKTTGNLSEEEATELSQLLAELRSGYVQVNQMVQQASAAGAVSPGGPGPGGPVPPQP